MCIYIYISQQFGSTDWFHKSVFSTAAMGKKQASRPTKRNVLSFSKSRMPDISNVQDQPGRVSFKEMKRRSILAGLRFMRSPPAPCLVIANEFKWVSNIFQPFSLFHQNKTQKIIQFGDVSFLPVSVLCSIYIYCNLGGFDAGKPCIYPPFDVEPIPRIGSPRALRWRLQHYEGWSAGKRKGSKRYVFKFRFLKHSWKVNLLLVQNVLFVCVCVRGGGSPGVQAGRHASVAMDIRHDKSMDLLDNSGFLAACYHATCLKPGKGGFLAAPVCSTFVYMWLGGWKRYKKWFVSALICLRRWKVCHKIVGEEAQNLDTYVFRSVRSDILNILIQSMHKQCIVYAHACWKSVM